MSWEFVGVRKHGLWGCHQDATVGHFPLPAAVHGEVIVEARLTWEEAKNWTPASIRRAIALRLSF